MFKRLQFNRPLTVYVEWSLCILIVLHMIYWENSIVFPFIIALHVNIWYYNNFNKTNKLLIILLFLTLPSIWQKYTFPFIEFLMSLYYRYNFAEAMGGDGNPDHEKEDKSKSKEKDKSYSKEEKDYSKEEEKKDYSKYEEEKKRPSDSWKPQHTYYDANNYSQSRYCGTASKNVFDNKNIGGTGFEQTPNSIVTEKLKTTTDFTTSYVENMQEKPGAAYFGGGMAASGVVIDSLYKKTLPTPWKALGYPLGSAVGADAYNRFQAKSIDRLNESFGKKPKNKSMSPTTSKTLSKNVEILTPKSSKISIDTPKQTSEVRSHKSSKNSVKASSVKSSVKFQHTPTKSPKGDFLAEHYFQPWE